MVNEETLQFTRLALWITSFVLPVALFLVANTFRRRWLTWLRATLAIACGWAFMMAYAIASTTMNFVMDVRSIDTDGAPLAFAAVLGWTLPAATVFAVWGARSFFVRERN